MLVLWLAGCAPRFALEDAQGALAVLDDAVPGGFEDLVTRRDGTVVDDAVTFTAVDGHTWDVSGTIVGAGWVGTLAVDGSVSALAGDAYGPTAASWSLSADLTGAKHGAVELSGTGWRWLGANDQYVDPDVPTDGTRNNVTVSGTLVVVGLEDLPQDFDYFVQYSVEDDARHSTLVIGDYEL